MVRSRRYAGALVCTVLLGSCTPASQPIEAQIASRIEEILSSAEDVAERTAIAWTERDQDALAEVTFTETDSRRFIRVAERAVADGLVSDAEVEIGELAEPRAEEIEGQVALSIAVPYTVTWTSDAAREPVSFDGEFTLAYADGHGWRALLEPGHLWPGIEGARGLAVTYRWPKRGAIRDRKGRLVARGRADERRYPFGAVAGSTIGHVGTLTAQDIEAGAEGEVGDLVGASGLEEAFQERLAGEPSSSLHVVGREGRTIETIGETEGAPGENIKITLDMELQRAAEQAYGSTVGGAVVMHPSSGDLLAVVDSSSFDPNNYVGATGVQPFNRALAGGYPPGSSMKVVTAAAALDSGVVTPSTRVTGPKEYKGVRNIESGEFGSIPFSSAVQFSVNTAFAQVAEELGADRLTRYAEAFGFNRVPSMALGARTPSFPEPAHLGDLMWASVGQAQVIATPLQMASVAATIANGGKRMEPRIDMSEPKTGERAVSRRSAQQLATMMQAVVEGGTGVNARISGVAVAGKTGTAEVDVAGERRNHAWFVAFAPVGDPSVSVAVVSEYGGVGGQVAAPLARAILVRSLPLAP
jgi:cell division protein FtsI/penicillin-binding protein 2